MIQGERSKRRLREFVCVGWERHDLAALLAFSDPRIEYVQQVAEGDRVASRMLFRGVHTGPVLRRPATGRTMSLASIPTDRFTGDKIAEHRSVADMAGFAQQLQP